MARKTKKKPLGKQLDEYIAMLDMSIGAAALTCGIHPGNLHRIISGETLQPTRETMAKLREGIKFEYSEE